MGEEDQLKLLLREYQAFFPPISSDARLQF